MTTYLTGDIHGNVDERFSPDALSKGGIFPTADDLLVILGDAAFIWSTRAKGYPCLSPRDERTVEQMLKAWPGDVAFVDGNHENHATLSKLTRTERWGAPVGVVCERLYHLLRGELYQLPLSDATATCFVMGGAFSIDKSWRVRGCDWWPEEIPSRSELAHGKRTLERASWSVDYVLTHDCAPSIQPVLTRDSPFGQLHHSDRLTVFLDQLDTRVNCTHWFCGHYHANIRVDERHSCLYEAVVPLERGLVC